MRAEPKSNLERLEAAVAQLIQTVDTIECEEEERRDEQGSHAPELVAPAVPG
jgi:hypothetical protein